MENQAGRESLPCLHWPHLEENIMADDGLCPPHPSGTSLTSYREGPSTHVEGTAGGYFLCLQGDGNSYFMGRG